MEIIILKSTDEVAAMGGALVGELLRVRPQAVLGLATGNTPLALYQYLVKQCRDGVISFKQASSFNLDEYLGVDPDNPQSYRAYMERELFDHTDINKHNTYLPACAEGMNPHQVCMQYEKSIRAAGGIDLQLLGIGANGHIGFNEPSSSLGSKTRVKTLTRQTLEDNSSLFSADEFQPKLAITMGIATILDARQIVLLATGKSKAEAVSKMVEGPVSAMCPASALQMHEHVTVLLDAEAASKLENRDYYDWACQQNEALKNRFGFPYEP